MMAGGVLRSGAVARHLDSRPRRRPAVRAQLARMSERPIAAPAALARRARRRRGPRVRGPSGRSERPRLTRPTSWSSGCARATTAGRKPKLRHRFDRSGMRERPRRLPAGNAVYALTPAPGAGSAAGRAASARAPAPRSRRSGLRQALQPGPGDHHAVVGAERGRRHDQAKALSCGKRGETARSSRLAATPPATTSVSPPDTCAEQRRAHGRCARPGCRRPPPGSSRRGRAAPAARARAARGARWSGAARS